MNNPLNQKFNKDFKKYGIENFRFDVLDAFDENMCTHHSEAYYINTFDTIKHGYNTEKGDIITCYKNKY